MTDWNSFMSNQTTEKKESQESSPRALKPGRRQKRSQVGPSNEQLKTIQVAKPVNEDNFEVWKSLGLKCYYARFQTPIPTGKNQEPVSEFRLTSTDKKYVVDELFYTPMGFIWSAHGETNITPLANVLHIRL